MCCECFSQLGPASISPRPQFVQKISIEILVPIWKFCPCVQSYVQQSLLKIRFNFLCVMVNKS